MALRESGSPAAPTRWRFLPISRVFPRECHTVRAMDPVQNPYAPGAGQRPPELAGRDDQLAHIEVVLERIARGRPERSVVLTGLRGVGKTVLLNAMRGAAVRAGWGTGKLEARPDQGLRRPLGAALHMAVRELGHPDATSVLSTLKAFVERDAPRTAKAHERWNPGILAPTVIGRADSGDIEIDLVELLGDVASLAADRGRGVGVFIDEMQDLGPDDVSALCAAVHELGQQRLPLVVVGAGLPHLPAVLSAAKSYSERLFRYQRIDRLDDAPHLARQLMMLLRIARGHAQRLRPAAQVRGFGATMLSQAPCAPPRAHEVERGVHRDAIEPGEKLGAPVEVVQRAIRAHERLLRRVVRVGVVAQEVQGGSVHTSLVLLHESTEGCSVPVTCQVEVSGAVRHWLGTIRRGPRYDNGSAPTIGCCLHGGAPAHTAHRGSAAPGATATMPAPRPAPRAP